MKTKKLAGVIVAIPTPLTANEDIDVRSLQNLIEYCILEGVNGIMVLGTMGEGVALLDSQRTSVIETTVAQVAGRIPVLATASGASTRKAVEYAIEIDKSGADYIVCTAPFYYRYPDEESVVLHLEKIADAVTTPLIFYNAPIFTGNPVPTDTLDRILNMEKVSGIKDSSCNYGSFVELLRRYPDRATRPGTIMQGDESVFDSSLLMGADGIVTGGGVVFIKLLAELYKAGSSGQRTAVVAAQRQFTQQLTQLLAPNPQRNWVANIKKALAEQQVISNPQVTMPFLT